MSSIDEIIESYDAFFTDAGKKSFTKAIQALITEARIDGAVMGAKFGNAAFRQQSIAKPGEPINLDTVRESGIKQAKEWAERNVE